MNCLDKTSTSLTLVTGPTPTLRWKTPDWTRPETLPGNETFGPGNPSPLLKRFPRVPKTLLSSSVEDILLSSTNGTHELDDPAFGALRRP